MLLVLSSMAAWAQSFAIKGNVTDESGEPLIGATVVMKGNAHVAAVTDFDGNFTLQAPPAPHHDCRDLRGHVAAGGEGHGRN